MNQMNFRLRCHERICKLIILALVSGFLFSCAEEDPEPFLSEGMITGTIYMYDDSDPINTRVIAHGPYGNPSTYANSDGSYELQGLGNGTYEVEFFKEGYGRIVKYGIQVYGNDTVRVDAWALRKMADYKIPQLSTVLYYNTFPNMWESEVGIVTDIPEANDEEMQIRVFVSDQKNVNSKNYLHTDPAYAVKREGSTQVMVFEANPQIVNSGGKLLFRSGQKLFIIAYVCSKEDQIGEFNEYYGLPVFSTVDEKQHSQVIEIIAP